MSPKMGRPPIENPKDTVLRVRLDKETVHDLKQCADTLQTNCSEVVRKGIQLVKSQIEKNRI